MKITLKNVNPNKLHDELISANLIPSLLQSDKSVGEHIAPNTWITFPQDTDMVLAQQIIDAHDPTPLPQPPSEKERLEALEQAMLEMILGGM